MINGGNYLSFPGQSGSDIELDQIRKKIVASGATASDLSPSPNKPIKATELYTKLRSIGWGKLDGRFLYDNQLWYRRYRFEKSTRNSISGVIDVAPDLPEYPIDILEPVADSPSGYSDLGFPISSGSNLKSIERSVVETYNKIFGTEMSGSEVIYHSSSRNFIDLLNKTTVIDVISSYDSYTNLADIRELIKFSTLPGVKAIVDVSVQYSRAFGTGNATTYRAYSRSVSFTAFEYSSSGDLIMEDQEFILGEVKVSSSSGIIEVLPTSKEINEYIISSCTVSYGKL